MSQVDAKTLFTDCRHQVPAPNMAHVVIADQRGQGNDPIVGHPTYAGCRKTTVDALLARSPPTKPENYTKPETNNLTGDDTTTGPRRITDPCRY